MTDVKIAGIRFLTETLAKIFNSFERWLQIFVYTKFHSRLDNELMNIVKQIHDFCGKTDLEVALKTLQSIDPTLKTFLPEAIWKLSWYYSISCDLIDAARNMKYDSIFALVSIEFLPQPKFKISSSQIILSCLARLWRMLPGRRHWLRTPRYMHRL